MPTTFLNFGPELDAIFKLAKQLVQESGADAATEQQVLAALAALAQATETQTQLILKKLDEILAWANLDTMAASVKFVVPTYRNIQTGEPIVMATSLLNDATSNIPLEFDNLAGQKVDAPSDQFSVAAVDGTGAPSTAVTVAMGADGNSVDATPVPADGTNMESFTIQFTDPSNAALAATLDCNFTNDPTAANAHFVTTGITTRPVGT